MKLIKAVVKPHKIEEIKSALTNIGITGMSLTDVRGHGRQQGHTEIYRGSEYEVDLIPKLQIETVVPDNVVDAVVKVISDAARTGKIGDGKIFIYPVDKVVRIRTEEIDDQAL